ncbi:hypothetical protein JOM56_010531 [Amanita muscaria]
MNRLKRRSKDLTGLMRRRKIVRNVWICFRIFRRWYIVKEKISHATRSFRGLIPLLLRHARDGDESSLWSSQEGPSSSNPQAEAEYIVVSWQHQYSRWKFILEVLTDYQPAPHASGSGVLQELSFGKKRSTEYLTLRLEDVGHGYSNRTDDSSLAALCTRQWRFGTYREPGKARPSRRPSRRT